MRRLRSHGFAGLSGASIDVNDFKYVYGPNIDPENEQETVELSVKIDKQFDSGTPTAWALYSDQDQYFIADGTSGAFFFYFGEQHCVDSTNATVGVPMQTPTFNLGFVGTPFPAPLQLDNV